MTTVHHKSRTVFQAGYSKRSLNSWSSCGYGATLDQARESLKSVLHIKGLQWIASFYKNNSDQPTDTATLLTLYNSGQEFGMDGMYLEQSYEEAIQ